jgi:hypothetical protein
LVSPQRPTSGLSLTDSKLGDTDHERTFGEWRPKVVTRAFYGGVSALLCAAMVFTTVASLADPIGGTSVVYLVGLVICAPSAYLAGRLALGIFRCRVEITSNRVLVVGPLKSRSVLLADVASFEARRYGQGSAAVWLVQTKADRARHGLGPPHATLLWAAQRGVVNGNVKRRSPFSSPSQLR